MDAKTFIERLYTDTAEEHLRTTSQAKEDLITALPEITKLLPTREAQLFEQVFQELSDKISQLQDTESSTHPAASVWEEFSADYENIELQLRIAGTTVNEAEKNESLRRAIIVARDASDKLTMNMVFHGMNHDIWEKQEEYIQVASHVIAQMLEKEEIRPLDLFVKRSRETVEETRRMNPARRRTLRCGSKNYRRCQQEHKRSLRTCSSPRPRGLPKGNHEEGRGILHEDGPSGRQAE